MQFLYFGDTRYERDETLILFLVGGRNHSFRRGEERKKTVKKEIFGKKLIQKDTFSVFEK